MIPFKIGNWQVDNDGIRWNGNPAIDYLIPKETLKDMGTGNHDGMYDWLIHLPSKIWLKDVDIYSLNTALIYALEQFGIGFESKLSFVKTFIKQQEEINDKSN